MAPLAICYDDIVQAHQRITGVALKTPVLTSSTANEQTGAQLFLNAKISSIWGHSNFEGPITRW